jgi:hypothetical protein
MPERIVVAAGARHRRRIAVRRFANDRVAASLKRSANRSHRRKVDPYRSALSMLIFHINRAGKKFSAARRDILQRAKKELCKQFGPV